MLQRSRCQRLQVPFTLAWVGAQKEALFKHHHIFRCWKVREGLRGGERCGIPLPVSEVMQTALKFKSEAENKTKFKKRKKSCYRAEEQREEQLQ